MRRCSSRWLACRVVWWKTPQQRPNAGFGSWRLRKPSFPVIIARSNRANRQRQPRRFGRYSARRICIEHNKQPTRKHAVRVHRARNISLHPPRAPCWPAVFCSVLAGACEFGAARASSRRRRIHPPRHAVCESRSRGARRRRRAPSSENTDDPRQRRTKRRWARRPRGVQTGAAGRPLSCGACGRRLPARGPPHSSGRGGHLRPTDQARPCRAGGWVRHITLTQDRIITSQYYMPYAPTHRRRTSQTGTAV